MSITVINKFNNTVGDDRCNPKNIFVFQHSTALCSIMGPGGVAQDFTLNGEDDFLTIGVIWPTGKPGKTCGYKITYASTLEKNATFLWPQSCVEKHTDTSGDPIKVVISRREGQDMQALWQMKITNKQFGTDNGPGSTVTVGDDDQ